MLPSTGPKGEPMATPSICWYVMMLKLNSTALVTVCISSIETSCRKDGALRSPKSIGTNINSFFQGNISKKTGYIKRAKESKRG